MSVPKLRFKEFDEAWKPSILADISNIVTGSTPATSKSEYYDGDFLFVSPADIQENRYVDATKTTLTKEGFNKCRHIPKNSILFVCIGSTIGKIAQNKEICATNQQINAVIPNNDHVSDFLYLVLDKLAPSIKLTAGVQAVPLINKTEFGKTELFTPTLGEQTKIASFLSNVDEKISQLTQKHELLSQYKQGMMQKLFSQQIRFKADDGSEFGEWEDKPLNEIASKRSGKNKDGSISEVLTNSATQGIIKQSDYFEREIVTESNLNGYYIVNLDDFVYNPRISVHAPVGPIKRNKKCLGVMSPLYTVFTVSEGNLAYLEYFFDSNFWHDYVKGVANSGARHDRMNITNKDFFDMPILYPCLEEQTKIANFLSAIDQKIEVVAQQIEQAKTWKKGLLQQMFV
nr:restriction endonuclease subunit S [Acinetobacter indicus]